MNLHEYQAKDLFREYGISVSKGILSGTGRNFGNPYLDIIQTDAAINQGSSGGAIVNADGELMGLSTSIASISGGSDGVGFALPAERVIYIANEIIKTILGSKNYLNNSILILNTLNLKLRIVKFKKIKKCICDL